MGQILYERPREKLRNRGIGFLTLAELIQLVIGSGSARVSGAKLAKLVEKLIHGQNVTYQTLLAVNGLGEAKACQILATLEISKRLASMQTALQKGQAVPPDVLETLFAGARASPVSSLQCAWFDGSMQLIDIKSYHINKAEHASVLVKRIFADVLAVSARSIVITLSHKKVEAVPTMADATLIKALSDTAQVLQVHMLDIYAVSKKVVLCWSQQK